MSEELATPEALAEVNTEAKDEQPSVETTEESVIDYESEFKREREAREKAEKALAEKRFKDSARRRRLEEDVEMDEYQNREVSEEKPLTADQLEAILFRERQLTKKELDRKEIEQFASNLSSSDAERKLVLEIHKNRIWPEHLSLEDQVEEAYVIANRKKLLGENSELKRALRGKQGINDNPAGTYQEPTKGSQPKISSIDAAEFARLGFKWNHVSRMYEKRLSNGQTLVRDMEAKKTYIR